MNVQSGQQAGTPDAELRRLLMRLWRARFWLVGSIVTFASVFAAIALLMKPVYQATTVLAPVNADGTNSLASSLGSFSGLASIAGIQLGAAGGMRAEESLAVLRSREFTEGFIVEQGLLPDLYERLWNFGAGAWRVGVAEQPSLAQAYDYFSEQRLAVRDERTGLVRVHVDWNDPQKAAEWANALVVRVNAVMRSRAIERSAASISFLQRELAATSTVETREAISRLLEAQINERMLATVTEEYAFRVVDKALAPDVREPLRPRKLLMIVLGAITGALVGTAIILTVTSIRS